MKLFNLDLHVAVIGDVKDIFNTLYGNRIKIVSWSISGHKHLFGLGPDHVDIVNEKTWMNIDEEMIEQFHVRWGWYMVQFDGFIVTHSPVFAMLYEKYNKPIIVVNSCRYDMPYCWTKYCLICCSVQPWESCWRIKSRDWRQASVGHTSRGVSSQTGQYNWWAIWFTWSSDGVGTGCCAKTFW